MPKGFTDREKTLIRARLTDKGKDLFSAYGVRKTNVEDLTRAAGISKGAFYLFFDSKEELFFELLEQFEAEFKAAMLQAIDQSQGDPRQTLQEVLQQALDVWRTNPLFSHFSKEEYEYLLRKLPEEKVQAHLQNDDSFADELVAHWQQRGIMIKHAPEMIAGLIRALFFVTLHEEEFTAGVYPAVMSTLVRLIADYIVQE